MDKVNALKVEIFDLLHLQDTLSLKLNQVANQKTAKMNELSALLKEQNAVAPQPMMTQEEAKTIAEAKQKLIAEHNATQQPSM